MPAAADGNSRFVTFKMFLPQSCKIDVSMIC